MDVYVVMIDDKHAETDCELFYSEQEAIDFAKHYVWMLSRSRLADFVENDDTSFLYSARYREENAVWVTKRSLK
jgi:hypothetical protein